VLTYDGQPSYTVSVMEFKNGKVARETSAIRLSRDLHALNGSN
jgi:hypothetical protein